jgi:superfamily II DNA/RNA helicase
MAQIARERALTKVRDGKLRVLVATDVAARGIDVQGVSHVVNHTCPEDEKTYIHRIGRTGRAGATGIAVTFVDWADLHRWKMINKALDLPFDEPQETYSTSPHLYHDLGIPTETKGRVVPARPEPARRGDGDGARTPRERPARTRTRQRTRTRSGQKVAAHADRSGSPAADQAASAERPAGQSRSRTRRRRRRSSGSGSGQAAS